MTVQNQPNYISKLLDQGHLLFMDDKGRAGTDKDAIWYLLKEMARVERTLRRGGPIPVGSAMPEVYFTPREIWETELAMAIDGITYAPTVRESATVADLKLHTEVSTWLRHVRSHSGKKRRHMLFALASGMTPQQAADCRRFDLDNPQAVRAAKFRAINDIHSYLSSVLRKAVA